jgi:hypothetical protein
MMEGGLAGEHIERAGAVNHSCTIAILQIDWFSLWADRLATWVQVLDVAIAGRKIEPKQPAGP